MLAKIKETLLSKKFWAMVSGVSLALANDDYSLAGQILMTYIGVEGGVNIAKALKAAPSSDTPKS